MTLPRTRVAARALKRETLLARRFLLTVTLTILVAAVLAHIAG